MTESPLLGPTRYESVGCSDCRFIGIKECPLGLQGEAAIYYANHLRSKESKESQWSGRC